MSDIKQKAKEYSSKNGNSNTTNKELLWYIVARLDEDRNDIIKIKTQQKIIWILLPICLTIVGYIGGFW